MKATKDMTREELALGLDDLAKVLPSFGGFIREAATRLRNSIDRPKVHVEYTPETDNLWLNHVNIGWVISGPWIERLAHDIRLALGMEGGEG